jgi:hypothetical protein
MADMSGLFGSEADAARATAADIASTKSKSDALKAEMQSVAANQTWSDWATSWCAAFVNTAYSAIGVQNTSPNPLSAKGWLSQGTPVPQEEAKKGDVIVFNRVSPKGWQGHVGIITANNEDGTFETIEGNTGIGGGKTGVGQKTRGQSGIGYGIAGIVRPDVPGYSAFGPELTTPSEIQAANRNYAALTKGMEGTPVWDGTYNAQFATPAPTPIFASALPDITPAPSATYGDLGLRAGVEPGSPTIASDNTGFGYPSVSSDTTGFGPDSSSAAGGFGGGGFSTGGGFGFEPSFARDDGGFHATTPSAFGGFGQSGAVPEGDMGDMGWHGTVPAAAAAAPGPSYSTGGGFGGGDFATAGGFGGGFSPANTGWAVDKDISPASPTIASDTTGGIPAPAPARPSPTDYGMGVPENYSFATPPAPAPTDAPAFSVDLPPEVFVPTFAAPAAPAIQAQPQPVAPSASFPRRSLPGTFSSPPSEAAPAPKQDFSAPPGFSAAFNGLWSPPSATQSRSAFAGLTGLSDRTVNALTSAYDAGGMLTGAAYSGLMDAFNNPSPNFAANAVSPVFASPLADLTSTASNPTGSTDPGAQTADTRSWSDRLAQAFSGLGGAFSGGGGWGDGTNPGLR